MHNAINLATAPPLNPSTPHPHLHPTTPNQNRLQKGSFGEITFVNSDTLSACVTGRLSGSGFQSQRRMTQWPRDRALFMQSFPGFFDVFCPVFVFGARARSLARWGTGDGRGALVLHYPSDVFFPPLSSLQWMTLKEAYLPGERLQYNHTLNGDVTGIGKARVFYNFCSD